MPAALRAPEESPGGTESGDCAGAGHGQRGQAEGEPGAGRGWRGPSPGGSRRASPLQSPACGSGAAAGSLCRGRAAGGVPGASGGAAFCPGPGPFPRGWGPWEGARGQGGSGRFAVLDHCLRWGDGRLGSQCFWARGSVFCGLPQRSEAPRVRGALAQPRHGRGGPGRAVGAGSGRPGPEPPPWAGSPPGRALCSGPRPGRPGERRVQGPPGLGLGLALPGSGAALSAQRRLGMARYRQGWEGNLE